MAFTPHQQTDIINGTTGWLDSNFGGIDLSSFPDLHTPPAEPKDDGRFARDWRDSDLSRSASALRNFVGAPDAEALERVGNETGNQNFLADVRDQRAEVAVMAFKRSRPQYLPTDQNFRNMIVTLAYNALPDSEQNQEPSDLVDLLCDRGHFTAENLRRVFDALEAQGMLEVETGTARNLSEREKLTVSRMAQRGQLDEALGEYLRCALDGEEPSMSMLSDPRYREACDSAVFYVFTEAQLDYQPTPERENYLRRFAGSRPLTIPLLREAWKSFQEHEHRLDRNQLLSTFEERPVEPPDLDELPDNEVDQLYHSSLREYASSVQRRSGILA